MNLSTFLKYFDIAIHILGVGKVRSIFLTLHGIKKRHDIKKLFPTSNICLIYKYFLKLFTIRGIFLSSVHESLLTIIIMYIQYIF